MQTFTDWLKEYDPEILDEALSGWKKAVGLGAAGLGIGLGGYMAGRGSAPPQSPPTSWTSPEAGKFLPSQNTATSPEAKEFLPGQDNTADYLNPSPGGSMTEPGKRPLTRAEEWQLRMQRRQAQQQQGTDKQIAPRSVTVP